MKKYINIKKVFIFFIAVCFIISGPSTAYAQELDQRKLIKSGLRYYDLSGCTDSLKQGPNISVEDKTGYTGIVEGDTPESRTGLEGTNAKAIFAFFVNELKLSSEQSLGILANIQQESTINPEAENPGNGAYGIIQWYLTRRTDLENFANNPELKEKLKTSRPEYLKDKPVTYKDLDVQLFNLKREFEEIPGYKKIYEAIKSADSGEDVVYLFHGRTVELSSSDELKTLFEKYGFNVGDGMEKSGDTPDHIKETRIKNLETLRTTFSTTASTTPKELTNNNIYVVGDSLSEGSDDEGKLSDKLKEAGFDEVLINASSGRSISGKGGTRDKSSGNEAIEKDKAFIEKAGVAVVILGTNREENFENNMAEFINKIKLTNNNIKIAWSNVGVTNQNLIENEKLVNEIIKKNESKLSKIIDWNATAKARPEILKDGVHPAGEYSVLAKLVVDSVKPFLKSSIPSTESIACICEDPVSNEISADSDDLSVENGSVQQWLDKYGTSAYNVGLKAKLPWETMLAQAALESGWGASASHNNFFGIKAGGEWTGPTFSSLTWEDGPSGPYSTVAEFRAYATPEDGFSGYGEFITKNSRYGEALKYPNDPLKYAEEIWKAGYATDTLYIQKISTIVREIIKVNNGKIKLSKDIDFGLIPSVIRNSTKSSTSGCNANSSKAGKYGWDLEDGNNKMVYYYQGDPKWGNIQWNPCGADGTIASSGCGITSIAMVVATLTDKKITPVEVHKKALEGNYAVCGAGTDWNGMLNLPKSYNLKNEDIKLDLNKAAENIKNGGLVIASFGPQSIFSDHYVVLRKISEDGNTFYIADPEKSYGEGTSQTTSSGVARKHPQTGEIMKTNKDGFTKEDILNNHLMNLWSISK